MAGRRRSSFLGVFITAALAVVLLPAFLSAGPIGLKAKGDAGESIQERATAAASQRSLVRNRRNISWYKQHSDFWNWYKFFTDNGNQEAVHEMDRIYLAYLQNKNRAEGRRSYKAYLHHLGDIYKSCADSDDPNCVSAYTSRPKPKPEAPKPAPVKTCDPTKDTYCLYAALIQGKSPYQPLVLPAAAPAKAPAPMYVRSAPAKDPQSGYQYYAPSSTPFLSKEQKAELLRICASEDVECLQYHLRAAYGYAPSAGPLPSYAHLGCDPKKDPSCKPKLVQKAPSGVYLQYPNCDPVRDPACAYAASLVAPRAPKQPTPAGPGSCNPLYEEGCNPLSATRFANPPHSYKNDEADEAAAIRAAPPVAEQNDPYAMFRDAYAQANRGSDPYAMYHQAPAAPPASPAASPQANDPYALLRRYMAQAQQNDPHSPRMEAAPESNPNDPFSAIREAAAAMHRRGPSNPRQQIPFSNPSYEEPAHEERHPLGPPGKTKEGYECFIGYDQDCFPVKPTEPRSGVHRHMPYPAEAYEPHLNADGTRNGVMEPSNPDCDPEYDRDCRLRRYEPEQPHVEAQPEHHAEEDHSQGAAEREYQPEQPEQEQYEAEPYQSGQEEPHMSYSPMSYPQMSYPQMSYPQMSNPQMSKGIPSLQDILRLYGDQSPEQDDRRAYAGDYRKK
ncbi:actinodin1 isoform X1 [Hippoglossus hippoglossus]|uniref:actinodin1 isoform X1 n=1 Tax=Hippoglossus hippoglossus TaxID=8267 RepID=UPI00148E69D9|nr:actinodin1 isoform X1 [Hippoglossus hippoglossus]XP_034428863.1 actinodin1 isoform X1 [Hippoglossus hippoglossus]XP_034428864.1 actinodin1 isoform X1 [Hippoglossus hippoglossus]